MTRRTVMVVALLLVGQMTGVITVVIESLGHDECAEVDRGETDCGDDCDACACCPHARPAVETRLVAWMPGAGPGAKPVDRPFTPPCPPVREIGHVPKASV